MLDTSTRFSLESALLFSGVVGVVASAGVPCALEPTVEPAVSMTERVRIAG